MLIILTKFAIALTAVLSFTMGIYTLLKNPKGRPSQLWFLNSIVVFIWSASGFALMVLESYTLAILAVKFFHFTTAFLFQEKAKKLFIIFGYAITSLIIILIFFSTLILKDYAYLEGFGYYGIPGALFYLLVITFLGYIIYTFYLLVRGYQASDGIRRKQIIYLIIGSGLGYLGASTGFFVNIFNVFPYGWLVIPIYPLLITYAIYLKKY